MEKVLCRRLMKLATRKSDQVSFGLVDDKRRYIGMRVTVCEVEMQANPDGVGGYRFVPGNYFMVDCQTTRNGIDYGASHGYEYFKTMAEAEDFAAKRIENAYNRYRKTNGPEMFARQQWAAWS